jgi:ankyrin repeat protein
LIWAAKLGHREAVERLLAYPVNREISDFSGKRALDWAKENQFHEIARLLVNNNLDKKTSDMGVISAEYAN